MSTKRNAKANSMKKGLSMKNNAEIVLFDPDRELRDTPGWNDLIPEKQERIAEITDDLLEYKRLEVRGVIGQCVALGRIKRELEGQPMTITDYVENIYGSGGRTAWRRLAFFEELKKLLSERAIKFLSTEEGSQILKGSNSQLRTFIEVVRNTPPPQNVTVEGERQYLLGVREEMKERKREANIKGQVAFNWDRAIQEALKELLKHLTRLTTSAERSKWLKRVLGYAMSQLAIAGTLEVNPIAVPEGMIAKRGRRPKSKKTL